MQLVIPDLDNAWVRSITRAYFNLIKVNIKPLAPEHVEDIAMLPPKSIWVTFSDRAAPLNLG